MDMDSIGSVEVLVCRPVELEGISGFHVVPGEEKQPGVLWRVVETHLMSNNLKWSFVLELR